MAKFNFKIIADKLKSFWEKSGARDKFESKDSRKKSRLIKLSVLVFLILLLIVVMKNREGKKISESMPSTPGEVDLGVDTKVLQKSWYAKADDELSEQNKRLEALERRMQTVLGEIEEKAEGYQSNFEKDFDATIKRLKAESAPNGEAEDRKPIVEAVRTPSEKAKPKGPQELKVPEKLPVKKAYPERPKIPTRENDRAAHRGNPTQSDRSRDSNKSQLTDLIHMDIEKTSFMDKEKNPPNPKPK